jgi:RNA polymerase sigma-70 factor (ECF subfamily)
MAERVAASTDASDDWSRVADAVAELPSAEWDTLLLFVWEELSYEQIAAALDIPVGTVRSRLNRARARLRDASTPESERMES